MKYAKVKIIDPHSPYCGMHGYLMDKYTLLNQHTGEKRHMARVIIPSDTKIGIQPSDQKWLGFEEQFIV